MTALSITTSRRSDLLHPLVAALTGVVVFATAMTSGEAFGLNAQGGEGANPSLAELGLYAAIVLTAVAIAVWLGLRAQAGSPRRLSATAVGLAVAAALTFVAFWSGWPHVFGAVAVALALEHRRRVGSFSGPTLTALVLGAVAFTGAAYLCVTG